MTKEEFDKYSKKYQRELVRKALVWFCVNELFTSYSIPSLQTERETIKIILGKIKDGEIEL